MEPSVTKNWWVLFWIGVACIGVALGIASDWIAQRAKPGDNIAVNYTLKLDDGYVLGTTVGKEPFQATLGKGMLVSGFEGAVIGMKLGERKTVTISPEQGYGQYRPELVQVLDRSKLPKGVNPTIGQRLEAYGKDNQKYMVTIIGFDDQTVTADMNHPLAGQNLTFDIELVSIGNMTITSHPSSTELTWTLFGMGVFFILGFILYNRLNMSRFPSKHRTSRLQSQYRQRIRNV